MLNASRQWLIRLLEAGSLPASSVPKSARADIDNMKAAGFILWERSGAGAKFFVADEAAVRGIIKSTGYEGDLSTLTPKARAVALHGDAHKGRDESLLFILTSASDATWTDGKHVLDVATTVENFGVASLIVRPGDTWKTNQPIGLVENIDLVLYGKEYFKRIGFDGSVVFYSGNISRKLLSWLAEFNRAPSYVVFSDYDLVGIKNYLYAKAALHEPVNLYIPENIKELLIKYGDPDKLKSKTSRKIIESSGDPAALRLYKLLLETGRGLDQEGLLLT